MARCHCGQTAGCAGTRCSQSACCCQVVTRYDPYSPVVPCPQPPIIFKAAAAANSQLSTGALTLLVFQAAIVANPNYALTTSTFRAPSAGMYSFLAAVTWSTPFPGTMFTLALQKNGATSSFAVSTTAVALGIFVTTVQGCLPLITGDVIGVSGLSTQNITIIGNNPYPSPLTFFQGQLVGY